MSDLHGSIAVEKSVHITTAADHHWLRVALVHRLDAWARHCEESLGIDDALLGRAAGLAQEAVRRLVIRRHRHSDEVRDVVGGRWKERLTPVNRLVAPSPAEDAVAGELSRTWLHRADGASFDLSNSAP